MKSSKSLHISVSSIHFVRPFLPGKWDLGQAQSSIDRIRLGVKFSMAKNCK